MNMNGVLTQEEIDALVEELTTEYGQEYKEYLKQAN